MRITTTHSRMIVKYYLFALCALVYFGLSTATKATQAPRASLKTRFNLAIINLDAFSQLLESIEAKSHRDLQQLDHFAEYAGRAIDDLMRILITCNLDLQILSSQQHKEFESLKMEHLLKSIGDLLFAKRQENTACDWQSIQTFRGSLIFAKTLITQLWTLEINTELQELCKSASWLKDQMKELHNQAIAIESSIRECK